MKFFTLITTLIFCCACQVHAADVNTLWQKGNSYYAQKQYDSAAICFEQIAAQRPENAAVYYNLGNTYYRLNRVGMSVLNYERALRIDPEYKEARDNLELAHSRITNHIPYVSDIFFITWWQAATRATLASAWAIAALLVFVLMVGLIMARRFTAGGKKIPAQAPGVLGFISLCLLVLAFVAAGNTAAHTRAVVMQNDAPLMNSGMKGKPLALIPEGTPVKVNEEKDGWAEVSLPDGRNGWVQQSLISRI